MFRWLGAQSPLFMRPCAGSPYFCVPCLHGILLLLPFIQSCISFLSDTVSSRLLACMLYTSADTILILHEHTGDDSCLVCMISLPLTHDAEWILDMNPVSSLFCFSAAFSWFCSYVFSDIQHAMHASHRIAAQYSGTLSSTHIIAGCSSYCLMITAAFTAPMTNCIQAQQRWYQSIYYLIGFRSDILCRYSFMHVFSEGFTALVYVCIPASKPFAVFFFLCREMQPIIFLLCGDFITQVLDIDPGCLIFRERWLLAYNQI